MNITPGRLRLNTDSEQLISVHSTPIESTDTTITVDGFYLEDVTQREIHEVDDEMGLDTSMVVVHDDQWRLHANEIYGIIDPDAQSRMILKVENLPAVANLLPSHTLINYILKILPMNLIGNIYRRSLRRRLTARMSPPPRPISMAQVMIFLSLELYILAGREDPVSGNSGEVSYETAMHSLRRTISRNRTHRPRTKDHLHLPLKVYKWLRPTLFIDEFFYKNVCNNIQTLLSCTGTVLCGDEKLFPCSQEVPHRFYVPHKPYPLGLWMCELTVRLPSGDPILVDAFMRKRGQSTSVDKYVSRWVDCIKSFNTEYSTNDKVLLFDAFYSSRDTFRLLLNESTADVRNKIYFCCSVRQSHPPNDITEFTNDDYGMILKDLDNIIYHKGVYRTSDGTLHRSICGTNAFEVGIVGNSETESPYLFYQRNFNLCDRYNQRLSQVYYIVRRRLPRFQVSPSREHDYILFCMCVNLYHFHKSFTINGIGPNIRLRLFIQQMAYELYHYVAHDLDNLSQQFLYQTRR